MDTVDRNILHELKKMPGVARTNTVISLSALKEELNV
jgi:hypothetical protein